MTMDREDYGRLVRVETRLETMDERLQKVDDDLDKHRSESARKHDELRDMLVKLGVKLDERAFKWGSIVNKDNAKLLAYVISALGAGGAVGSVAKALLLGE